MSTLIITIRAIVLILSFTAAIIFSISGYYKPEMVLLNVFTWIWVVWNAGMLAGPLMTHGFRLSLVLSNGKVIGRDAESDAAGSGRPGKVRKLCSRIAAFVEPLLLLLVFVFNLTNSIIQPWWYGSGLQLNWAPIGLYLIVVVLSYVPQLAESHVRFGSAGNPQIALP
ncbi:hypothetical protein F4808DRAFT_361978 [Astrocystis sublimbata]|nr:hypothetical protein F4808DRAFT_361978 [Astrocystis sublimbata]